MAEATLTSKGQVTIPADIRRWLKLHASDRITFTRHGVAAGKDRVAGRSGRHAAPEGTQGRPR